MDLDGILHLGSVQPNKTKDFESFTVKTLKVIAPRLRMAEGYLKIIHKTKERFTTVREISGFHHRSREMELSKTVEMELKMIGSLQNTDKNTELDGSDSLGQAHPQASTKYLWQGSVDKGIEPTVNSISSTTKHINNILPRAPIRKI